jgi:hypothetical protein
MEGLCANFVSPVYIVSMKHLSLSHRGSVDENGLCKFYSIVVQQVILDKYFVNNAVIPEVYSKFKQITFKRKQTVK